MGSSLEHQTWYGLTREEGDTLPEATLASGAWEPRGGPVGRPPPADPAGRYVFEGFLARGGMGEVWVARDTALDVRVAMKILAPHLGLREGFLERFQLEARVTARLDHPGVVPVHDLGTLLDGRAFYTMKRIEGRPLRELLPPEEALDGPLDELALRRRVGLFARACEAVSYAHARGVVHRDLKPDNIVVGDAGSVLVVDWGLALVLEGAGAGGGAGTPGYMAPEQLMAPAAVGPASDVYALGVVLFEVLTGCRPGLVEEEDLAPFPEELVALAMACLRERPEDRPAHAGIVLVEVQAWLDGARRREQALAVVVQADAKAAEATALEAAALELEVLAAAELEEVPEHAPAEAKHRGWALQEAAARSRREAELARVARIQLLNAALTHHPTLPEARQRLAAWYRGLHEEAEAKGEAAEAIALMLRSFDDGQHRVYLEGRARLSIASAPGGAEVEVYRFELRHRRLEPVTTGVVVTTPVEGLALDHGSYLLVFRHPDCEEVSYPVVLGRGEDWRLLAPGEDAPRSVPLPPRGSLGADECYVPAGWSQVGADAAFANAVTPRRVWVEGFVACRHPVTQGEYLEFLNALVAEGRLEEARALAPAPGRTGEKAESYYGFEDGRFKLVVDADGDEWLAGWPLIFVDERSKQAFIAWRAARDGQAWRRPREDEWERMVRGADGRVYPWGNHFDSSRAVTRTFHDGRIRVREVGTAEADRSVFGVRDLAGCIRETCACVWPPSTPSFQGWPVIRGAAWNTHLQLAAAYGRTWMHPSTREHSVGFRLARPWRSG